MKEFNTDVLIVGSGLVGLVAAHCLSSLNYKVILVDKKNFINSQNAFKDTNKMLTNLGFSNYKLIMGLLNSKRILINDFNQANPYPNALAFNIYRDEDNLDKILNV